MNNDRSIISNPKASSVSPNNGHRSFKQSGYATVRAFSLTEKVVFYILLIVALITGLTLLGNINNRFLVSVPNYGGSLTEGVVGIPRFANPVLAVSDADRDITTLVFSGLLKSTPDGKLVPDLSSEYSISADGRTYSFTLKENIEFQDGEPITTDDVEFTIQRIQDPTIKSPKRPVWDSVTIQKTDSRHISFTLKQPYAPFIENFTTGIIPHHIWKNVPSDEFSFSEFNVNAVGSGPYKISKVKRNSYGLTNYYILRSFDKYALGRPFIKEIILRFYQSEDEVVDAFQSGEVESMNSVSPGLLKDISTEENKVVTSVLPRVFGLFFNQNQSAVFLNKEVRQALQVAIDKDRIVNDVLSGYASVISSPVPYSKQTLAPNTASTTPRADQAIRILTKAGWTLNAQTGVMEKKVGSSIQSLSFTISTGDAAELRQTAEFVKEDWEKIGASVEVKIFEIGDLNQNVIRPRKFDVLLFGEVVGREFDLYPFWHSSQRNDPGLNIALYANISADKILENLRTLQDQKERMKKAGEFENLFKEDLPAVFIYSPHFIYVIPEKLKNVSVGEIISPSERFLNVNEWFIETNKVWEIFT